MPNVSGPFRSFLDRLPPLTDAEEQHLRHRIRGGDHGARPRLAEGCIRLALKMANRHAYLQPAERDDVLGAALLALVKAAATFDPDDPRPFSAIAWSRCWAATGREAIPVRGGTLAPAHVIQQDPERARGCSVVPLPDGAEDGAWFGSREISPERAALMRCLWDWALSRLGEREARVLTMRMQGMTLQEVGQVVGLGKERVRQVQVAALEAIRAEM